MKIDNFIELDGKETLARTETICILDRSGSMGGTVDDSIGGYNTFLKKQKEDDGENTITLVLFDNKYDVIYENIDINEVDDLTDKVYIPRGMTSLNDAIGRTLVTARERHMKLPEDKRPENVVVAILTDGMENSSREYSSDKIKELVKLYEKEYNWKFMYLAANQDSFAVGQAYGFSRGNTLNFCDTGVGRQHAFANVSSYTSQSKMRGLTSESLCRSFAPISESDMDEDFKNGGSNAVDAQASKTDDDSSDN